LADLIQLLAVHMTYLDFVGLGNSLGFSRQHILPVFTAKLEN